ncbi:unnamed protein product [Phaeothamnion confervicola]
MQTYAGRTSHSRAEPPRLLAVSLTPSSTQECFGSFLMMVLLFPFGSILGDTWAGWVQHFAAVLFIDWLTGGAQLNPSVSIAAIFFGWNDVPTAAVRIAGEFVGGCLSFPAMAMVLPPYVKLGGPVLGAGVSTGEGAAWEFGLTFALLMVVLFAATQIGLPAQRPVIASGIRALIVLGGKTGPAMNPMIAAAWAMFAVPGWATPEHFLVYWAAPTAGAILAVLIFKALEPKKKAKKD